MSPIRDIAAALTIVLLCACSSETELRCGNQTRYREAVSTGTLRIPDDLSVPDESESLQIPGASVVTQGSTEGQEGEPVCLEESPAFSDPPQP